MYIALQTLTMDGCDLEKPAYAEARETWLCTGCCAPKPEVRSIDVHLEERPGDKPLNLVSGCGLGVIFRPFLEKFPADIVERDLYLGKVYGPNGEEIPDWLTFRGRRRVIVRGTKHAGTRVCDQCGRDVYFAMDKTYLYPAPPSDATLFESDLTGLVFPLDLYEQLDLGKWRKLKIYKLRIVDDPPDGLGILANP